MQLAIRLALWAYLLAQVLEASFGPPPTHFRVGCDGSKTGYFALDPEDFTCRRFLKCLPNVQKLRCDPPLIFDIFAEMCSWPGNTWCPLQPGSYPGGPAGNAGLGIRGKTSQNKNAPSQNISNDGYPWTVRPIDSLDTRTTPQSKNAPSQTGSHDTFGPTGRSDSQRTNPQNRYPPSQISSQDTFGPTGRSDTRRTNPQNSYAPSQNSSHGACKRVVCYFTSWAQHRSSWGTFLPEHVNPFHCTHLIYAFAKLKGNRVMSVETNDDKHGNSEGMYRRIAALKKKNPSLKVMLAVGERKIGAKAFLDMAATTVQRLEFVASTIRFLRERGFDGLDIHWKYPDTDGGKRLWGKQKFSSLLRETINEFRKEAKRSGRPRLILSAAVSAEKSHIDAGYQMWSIRRYLDFANLMSYGFDKPSTNVPRLHNPLYSRTASRSGNMDWAARYWVARGFPREKLVLGTALYGSSSRFIRSKLEPGKPGMYTNEKGFLAYYEVCHEIKKKASKVIMDLYGRVPYAITEDGFISYENPTSLRFKVHYAISGGYGGVMIWALGLDDFAGMFCQLGKFPLVESILSSCREFAGVQPGKEIPTLP